ncbi:radical SAM protein [Maridesulfovibrio sp. FT414]|uniref:radical SAM protein n=1 Tax=Maridesulfovibrio sp. FT414 TaxID=2979469 RepID=UPI003D807C6C
MNIAEKLASAAELLSNDKFIEAEVLCRQVLNEDLNNACAYGLLAELAYAKRKFNDSYELYEESFRLSDPSKKDILKFAEICTKLGMKNRAYELLSSNLSKFENDNDFVSVYHQISFDISNFDSFACDSVSLDVEDDYKKGMLFNVITVVWGQEYVDLYINYVLQTIIGDRNIGSLSRDRRALFVLYTTLDGWDRIKRSRYFDLLLTYVDFRAYMVPENCFKSVDKYESMTRCHKHALRSAVLDGARLVILAPDVIFSEGTFEYLYSKSYDGCKAVLVGGLIADRSKVLKEISTRLDCAADTPVSFPSRELCKLAIANLHKNDEDCFASLDGVSSWPSRMFWRVSNDGIVAHYFHRHPLMLKVDECLDFDKSIDYGLLGPLVHDLDSMCIVNDSDDIMVMGLSAPAEAERVYLAGAGEEAVAAWAREHTDVFERKMYCQEFCYHTDSLSQSWYKIRSEAKNFTTRVLRAIDDNSVHTFAKDIADHDLNYPLPVLDSISFQMTSKCNLSCTYCPQHWNKSAGIDMDSHLIRKIVDDIKTRGVASACLGFYGETLINRDWVIYAEELLDHGVSLDICSNLNMSLSSREIEALSRFDHIQMSIDVTDPALLKEIRPPANLGRMIVNMHKIRAAAISSGRTPPPFQWMCTLTDKVVPFLPDLVAFAVSNGVKELGCNDLVYFDDRNLDINSILSLHGVDFVNAVRAVELAKGLAQKHGVRMSLLPSWDDIVENKSTIERVQNDHGVEVSLSLSPVALSEPMDNIQGNGRIFRHAATIPGADETRACLYPWNSAYVMPDGNVFSCCIRGEVMGRVDEICSLELIMNNSKYLDLRRQLLSGKINDPLCLNCPITYVIPVREMKRRVASLLRSVVA